MNRNITASVKRARLALAPALFIAASLNGPAQGTAFLYQGRLTESAAPANGLYDFRCQVYTRAVAGQPGDALVSSTIEALGVAVTNGLFLLNLDFGSAPFDGQDRWLFLQVRTNNAVSYTPLNPRQPLAPVPYSIRSATAGMLNGLNSTAFVLKAGDTMTGKLTVNGPGGIATFSDTGLLLGNDIAVSGNANSLLGIGVSAGSVGDSGYGVYATAGGNNGVALFAQADTGANSRALDAHSAGGLAGNFDGAVQISYASPFNKPQLTVRDPSDSGFARLRLQTGTRPLWDIAVGTTAAILQTNSLRFFSDGNGDVMTLATNGTLFVRVITITGGADIAEPFKMSHANLAKGAVVVIDEAHPGQLKLSTEPYDTRVAGVISGANGVNPGLALNQQGLIDGDQPVALTGRVYVQADASFGAIRPGDLLTTSATPGHAMRVSQPARAQGAILGKAMTGLKSGQGLVLLLVTLQ